MSYILQALKKSEQEREQLELSALFNEGPVSIDTIIINDDASECDDALISSVKWPRVILVSIIFASFAAVYIYQQSTAKPIKERFSEVAIKAEVENLELVVEKSIVKDIAELAKLPDKAGSSSQQPQVIRPKMAAEQASKEIQSLIPSIEISSHIYSSLPARRSIVVNNERLVEADFITPQVQVKEITRLGMIIDVNGWPLVISRSRGWSR